MGCFYLKGSGLRRSSKHFPFWVQRAPRALPSSSASLGVWHRGQVSTETWVGCAGDLGASRPRRPRVSLWVHVRPCVPAGFLAPLEPWSSQHQLPRLWNGRHHASHRLVKTRKGGRPCCVWPWADWWVWEVWGGLLLCSLTPVMWRRTSSGPLWAHLWNKMDITASSWDTASGVAKTWEIPSL